MRLFSGGKGRWTVALRALWRAEPLCALAAYFALAAVQVANFAVLGSHHRGLLAAARFGPLHFGEGSAAGLIVYAYFVWRMWIGGYIAWTLSLVWALTLVVAGAHALYQAPDLFTACLLAINAASLLMLLTRAVLDRVDPASRAAWVRKRRSSGPEQSTIA